MGGLGKPRQLSLSLQEGSVSCGERATLPTAGRVALLRRQRVAGCIGIGTGIGLRANGLRGEPLRLVTRGAREHWRGVARAVAR